MSFIASSLRSLGALGFIALTSAGGVTLQPAQGTGIREVDLPVPMRDGVVLRADVTRPAGSQRFPTLVYRTPYGKAEAQRIYTTFQRAVSRQVADGTKALHGLGEACGFQLAPRRFHRRHHRELIQHQRRIFDEYGVRQCGLLRGRDNTSAHLRQALFIHVMLF